MAEWWKEIPVSINNAFGDPLTELQIEDTCKKLELLKNHEAAYGFSTKCVPTENVYNLLREVTKSNNLFVRYSLTGLDEGGFNFDDRVNTIYKLFDIFGDITIVVKPIIEGRNDDYNNLERIVKVAKDTGGKLVAAAIHDEYKRKRVYNNVREMLLELCDKYGVKIFAKTSCAAAYVTNHDCWVHDLHNPIRLEVLNELGYKYRMVNGQICFNKATVGDLNFLRMITHSYILTDELISGYNLLSISTEEQKFEVTSSWYAWSRNVPCSINCDYCIIRNIEYLDRKCLIGMDPKEIKEFVQTNKLGTGSQRYLGGAYRKEHNGGNIVGYNQVRTIQECYRYKYDS